MTSLEGIGRVRYIGAKNVLSPLGAWTSRIAIDESVADENHLKPSMPHGPSGNSLRETSKCGGEYVAIVSVPDTSLPPFVRSSTARSSMRIRDLGKQGDCMRPVSLGA